MIIKLKKPKNGYSKPVSDTVHEIVELLTEHGMFATNHIVGNQFTMETEHFDTSYQERLKQIDGDTYQLAGITFKLARRGQMSYEENLLPHRKEDRFRIGNNKKSPTHTQDASKILTIDKNVDPNKPFISDRSEQVQRVYETYLRRAIAEFRKWIDSSKGYQLKSTYTCQLDSNRKVTRTFCLPEDDEREILNLMREKRAQIGKQVLSRYRKIVK